MPTDNIQSTPDSAVEMIKESIRYEYGFAYVISEMRRLNCSLVGIQDEISRLTMEVRRPDRVKYTIKDATRRLGRSRSSLYALIKSREINPIKEQGRTYITEEEIQRWERTNRI